MTSPWTSVRRAATGTFAVHTLKTLFALALVVPCFGLIAKPWSQSIFGRQLHGSDAALVLEGLRELPGQLGYRAFIAAGLIVLYLIVAPWVSMFWLDTLHRPGRLLDACQTASRRYVAAILVSLGCLVGVAVSTFVLIGVPLFVRGALAATNDPRLQDLAALAFTLPGLAATLWVVTWHDLARAALVTERRAPSRALGEAFAATTPGAVMENLRVGLAILLVTILGGLFAAALHNPSPLAAAGILAVQQTAALAATFLRGRWLAAAVQRTVPAQA